VRSELRVPARASKLGAARDFAHEAAAAFGFDAERCFEFAYAANEAVTNAIRHGRPDEHGHIHVSVLADDERLTLTVRDYGTFAGVPPAGCAGAEHGRAGAERAGAKRAGSEHAIAERAAAGRAAAERAGAEYAGAERAGAKRAGSEHAIAEHGRGFVLMASLMDAVHLCVAPGSTTVHLSKARA
jgi:anti-sigma regulatory factor (Ser/Thr protein kinase)